MKKLFIALMLIGVAAAACAQSDAKATTKANDATAEEEVFLIVEQEAEFPGGLDALSKYLSANLTYPQEARDANVEGKVIVQFVIEKNGKVSNIKVLRDIGSGCGEEAVRVIKGMPRWKPGQQRGKPVRCQFTLPVNFQLQ
ncbi:MAG: energy transducer TonB [Bacteroidales bacterium]|nr:energy transducer TonB [Bacteroidales bacterium]